MILYTTYLFYLIQNGEVARLGKIFKRAFTYYVSEYLVRVGRVVRKLVISLPIKGGWVLFKF